MVTAYSPPHLKKNLKSLIAFFFPKMEELFHQPKGSIFLCYALLWKSFNPASYKHVNKQGRRQEMKTLQVHPILIPPGQTQRYMVLIKAARIVP